MDGKLQRQQSLDFMVTVKVRYVGTSAAKALCKPFGLTQLELEAQLDSFSNNFEH
jgi:hypothetical protein